MPVIPDSELEFRFFRAGGPGGQNVNKVATAVQLRFDAAHSPSLDEGTRARLIKLAGSRATQAGEILISAVRFRTQERNRADAVERLQALVDQAAVRPTYRVPTKPSRAARTRRMDDKSRRGDIKSGRARPVRDD